MLLLYTACCLSMYLMGGIMFFKIRFYGKAALIALISFAPLASAQAGQLFPPDDLATAGTPNIACPNGKLLNWTGETVRCTDPSPGVTVPSCPSGQAVTGVVNGVASCAAIPTPPIGGMPLYAQTVTWDYASPAYATYKNATPDSYNVTMAAALSQWGPLQGNPSQLAAWRQMCLVYADPSQNTAGSPNTTNNQTLQGQLISSTASNNSTLVQCGTILCDYVIPGYTTFLDQWNGDCAVSSPNCGSMGHNGFSPLLKTEWVLGNHLAS
jgi:hypothetical protein